MPERGCTVGKTFQYKLQPRPEQEQALEVVLRQCRLLYNTAWCSASSGGDGGRARVSRAISRKRS